MNQTTLNVLITCMGIPVLFAGTLTSAFAQSHQPSRALDAKVEKFLNENRAYWHDWNVPYEDGRVLYSLIVKNNYRKALEIGTSTGHSAIWMAWALSKTNGKLITIEIDENRYGTALKNFKKAGVEEFIDARLADAHQLVKELAGPFDFVFSDADKEWYTQYFKNTEKKLAVGGCFTAHNVTDGFGGIKEFLDYIRSLSNYQTTIDRSSSSGISISYKKSSAPS
ncbi:MAG TPA: class I SAM-dependent methyltransferase [Thermodesulfobacteriota bacterium]|nr:class I SAM-dependent methyltransferase [Thermodesulfobacteriota bacterium]